MAYVGPLYHQMLQGMFDEFDARQAFANPCGAYACAYPGRAAAWCGPQSCGARCGPSARRLARPASSPPRRPPSVQLQESGDSYFVSITADGLARKDFNVQLKDGRLLVTADLPHGRTFQREYQMPDDADQDAIRAKHEGGELRITIPKVKKQEAVTITVEGAQSSSAHPASPQAPEASPALAHVPDAEPAAPADAPDFDGKIETVLEPTGSPKAEDIPEDHYILVPPPPNAPKSWAGSPRASPAASVSSGSGHSTPVLVSQPGSPGKQDKKGKAPMEPEVVAAIERQLQEVAMECQQDSD